MAGKTKEGKSAKAAKAEKGAKTDKGAKGKKGEKQEKRELSINPLSIGDTAMIELDDTAEKTMQNEEVPKIEKNLESGDAEVIDSETKKTEKTKGKAGKAEKAIKEKKSERVRGTKGGKATKEEKQKKAGGKTGKIVVEKTDKVEDDAIVDETASPAQENEKTEPAVLEEITVPPEVTEAISDLPTSELLERDEFFASEEASQDEQKDELVSPFIIEEEIEEEISEEETFKHDTIDDRYPIESNESEEEDKFGEATAYIEDRKTSVKEVDFFDVLGRIPDLDEISLDASILRYIRKMEAAQIDHEDEHEHEHEDEGEGEGEGEEEEDEGEERFTEVTQDDTKIPIEDIFTSEISLEYDFESSSEEEGPEVAEEKISEENLFEALIALEEKAVEVEYIDFELLERLAEERQVQEDTKAFLYELFDCVVDVAEYVDPKQVLRESLDKVKLFGRLCDLIGETTSERKVNSFLHRKCVEYYRRQKAFRAIIPDAPETIDEDQRKYHEIIDQLNALLGKETEMAQIILNKVSETEFEEEKAKEEVESSLDDLNSLIRKTFAKRGSDHLNIFVEKRIKEMSMLRDELSEVRAILIHRQHTKARLNAKMDALENVGPGLHLRDYETLQNETYSLVKKLEERNQDLDKFRNRFNGHTNILAHLREKETMTYQVIQAQQDILNEVKWEKRHLRAVIHQLKTSRVRVKKQIREMSYQCGLIDKPALCIDYDETLESCIKLREDVKNMKRDAALLDKKIAYYSKCPEKIFRVSLNG